MVKYIMVNNPNSAGWTFVGTICCGFVFAIPVILGYLLVRSIVRSVEKRKEKLAKQQTVV